MCKVPGVIATDLNLWDESWRCEMRQWGEDRSRLGGPSDVSNDIRSGSESMKTTSAGISRVSVFVLLAGHVLASKVCFTCPMHRSSHCFGRHCRVRLVTFTQLGGMDNDCIAHLIWIDVIRARHCVQQLVQTATSTEQSLREHSSSSLTNLIQAHISVVGWDNHYVCSYTKESFQEQD